MPLDTFCHAVATALHHHYAGAGLAFTPSRMPEIAPQIHRSI
jgi:hypothetical protein